MRKRSILILLQLLVSIIAWAQSPGQVLNWINTVRPNQHDFYAEIPFEYKNGCIVVQVTIGKENYDYIFDTGGYNDITDAIQAKNHFPVLTTQTVGSSNKLKSKVDLVRVDSLRIGPLVFRDVAALQMNFKNSPTIDCTVNGALIGASIIKLYCWQIDLERKKIIITDRPERLDLAGAVKLPVTFNTRQMPYFTGKLNGHDEKFMFDLGSSSLCILTPKTAANYTGKTPVIEVDNVASEGGNGVLKQTMKLFAADLLELGAIRLQKVPVFSLATVNENLIGNPILQNYRVTLDFPHSAIYLSPLSNAPYQPGLESFGFSLKYENGQVVISNLYKGHAAERAGLRTGDVVSYANGRALSYSDACSSIVPLAALLRSKDIDLTIIRNGQPFTLHLQKTRLF